MLYFKSTPNEDVMDESITLEKAIDELVNLPVESNSHLGFTCNDDTVQFIRFGVDNYMIDVPILENGVFVESKQSELTLEKAKQLVNLFFDGKTVSEILLNINQVSTGARTLDSANQSDYISEILCNCGSSEFIAKRLDISSIKLSCIQCSKVYNLDVDISEEKDGTNPVISFTGSI